MYFFFSSQKNNFLGRTMNENVFPFSDRFVRYYANRTKYFFLLYENKRDDCFINYPDYLNE